jgi:IS5 family transposase
LDRIGKLVKWYRFEKLLARLHEAATGRPAYPSLVMFKALLLAQWYGLSDLGLEEALNDRLSFRRFTGLGLDGDTPDHTTLCRFRNDLAAAGLAEKLFEEMNRQLERLGLVLKRGTLIDATLVEAATKPPAYGSDEEATDPEAAFGKRSGRGGSTYGFKAHVAVDQSTILIRDAILTPGNINDTVVADELIQGDERAVYADAAYDTHDRRAALKARGIKDGIMHRPNKHHPELPPRQRRRNRAISTIRAQVETIFAILKRHYGYVRVRYRGLIKNQSHLYLLCIALNLRRAVVLTR